MKPKKVYVEVVPPCISISREEQYAWKTENAFRNGNLESNMEIKEETDEYVLIVYRR